MLVHINSYPGVGKLTIGSALADQIGGKLLDNHSIYNIAFALTEFRSPSFYDTVRATRDLAYQRVLALPATTSVILTNWYSKGSAWGEENWDEVISGAPPSVHAGCRDSKLFTRREYAANSKFRPRCDEEASRCGVGQRQSRWSAFDRSRR